MHGGWGGSCNNWGAGACVAVGGWRLVWRLGGGGLLVVRAGETATEAGSTHPTGMHSCNIIFYCFDRSSLCGGQTVR